MSSFEKALVKMMHCLPPEAAHMLAIKGLKYGPSCLSFPSLLHKAHPDLSCLKVNIFGRDFAIPLGMAAGFDKNGECVEALFKRGFSLVEVGTVTLKSQLGNPKPRMFRLPQDEALINRLGFNNLGIDYLLNETASISKNRFFGINIGCNKDSLDRTKDYIQLIQKIEGTNNNCSYITINISSPNTIALRNLQQKDLLEPLLRVARSVCKTKLLFLKLSPDLSDKELEEVLELALRYKLNAIILTNTTIEGKTQLRSPDRNQAGGLSGKPLAILSDKIIRKAYKFLRGEIPIIGCGGVRSGEDAFNKILSGATFVQLYTAIIYSGFSIIPKIAHELSELLRASNFKNISEAVGQHCEL